MLAAFYETHGRGGVNTITYSILLNTASHGMRRVKFVHKD